MVRILKDKNTKLAYIPEVLIRMYYGGTSNSTAKSYIVSILEAHASLRGNNVKFAWWVTFRRTLKVLGQFKNGRGMKNV
jgi:hypothetical protein